MVLSSLPASSIRTLRSRARRISLGYLEVFYLANDLGVNRLGVIVSKKVSKKAVDRNRAKRLVREAVRGFILGPTTNFDYLIIVRSAEILEKSPRDMETTLQGALPKKS